MKEKKTALFVTVGILISLIIAMALSLVASSFPDGLEKVAERLGFIESAREIVPEAYFAIPDYGVRGVANEYLATSLAGLLGILIILALFAIVYLIYRAAHRKSSQQE